ncbi:hypothetical protein PZ938_00555 [Luteipulveratus sp. YIM 133132]|uniref:Uncharacterized protein n=1 Tax=Luteipulveratus flavus TaxID=3031728 RepID=A0ABT6C453_9MICO|nr:MULTISPECIES: hypothetical protein [unclassified Luteipulveratus]MDE9364084.1 hypothetical protein [Luteipulveratus sp. YIM 133132]MDF8263588.1 hypothetical protein [Luteipulveratus sp. YIM 133296]
MIASPDADHERGCTATHHQKSCAAESDRGQAVPGTTLVTSSTAGGHRDGSCEG